jgi:hypothetical protein
MVTAVGVTAVLGGGVETLLPPPQPLNKLKVKRSSGIWPAFVGRGFILTTLFLDEPGYSLLSNKPKTYRRVPTIGLMTPELTSLCRNVLSAFVEPNRRLRSLNLAQSCTALLNSHGKLCSGGQLKGMSGERVVLP